MIGVTAGSVPAAVVENKPLGYVPVDARPDYPVDISFLSSGPNLSEPFSIICLPCIDPTRLRLCGVVCDAHTSPDAARDLLSFCLS